ncbi:MAG: hypothetical protein RLZZ200_947 [Pseudomonadota bacterium]|jgi:uncharacterized DUF497 family protein
MEFEYDPWKSLVNADKHGIDFVKAQALWDDPELSIVLAASSREPRYIAIGKIGYRHWAAIYTLRGSITRLISVRRARREEIAAYEEEKGVD